MKRIYYMGVIKSNKDFKIWAFGGAFSTERKAFDECGNDKKCFINVALLNDSFEEKWETDQSKLGYYPALEPERLGELTRCKL